MLYAQKNKWYTKIISQKGGNKLLYTTDTLLKNCLKKYDIKNISEVCSHKIVTWIYLAEDIENINFINSNQLIITTGLFTTGGVSVYDFIYALINRGMSGIIINTGKYICDDEISNDILTMCAENDFPLYTMPWRVHITDLMQELCGKLIKDKSIRSSLTDAFKYAFEAPDKRENYANILEMNGFYDSFKYRVMNVSGIFTQYKINNILNRENIKSHVIECKSGIFVITANDSDCIKTAEKIADCGEQKKVKIGVSSWETGYKCFSLLKTQAEAALKATEVLDENVVFYDDMGLLGLIFAVEDKELLKRFYIKRLSVFEEYDKNHNGSLIDTLYYYIKTGGSLADTAKLMFTHRNTINYRINKIKEIGGDNLDSQEKRFEFLTAIYIRKILSCTEVK